MKSAVQLCKLMLASLGVVEGDGCNIIRKESSCPYRATAMAVSESIHSALGWLHRLVAPACIFFVIVVNSNTII